MKIVVLDGRTLAADGNSWSALDELGAVEIYERSMPDEVAVRVHLLDLPAEVADVVFGPAAFIM